MGTTMGTIRFAVHGDPDRYRTAIGNARSRSKIAKGLAIPVTMVITLSGSSVVAETGLRSTSNSVHWEPMFIVYCRRSMCEDYRLASEIYRVAAEVNNVTMQREFSGRA
ncbi:hypothetical protein Tco_0500912 [Tanacetum coccineum]